MSRPTDLGSIKEGSNVIIEGEPCRVVEVEKSKPGKHGSAKVRLVGIGIFDGVKRSMVGPADSKVEVPVIEKRIGQVISIGDVVSVMDKETLDVVEVPLPSDEKLRSSVSLGSTVEFWKILNRYLIHQVRRE
ncbi:MAG: translation initiation factor IF-5A [Aigarchaeota archaeon]|nr:translation initiation factor IF-5A [Aigarchaeota archaeon]MDW8092611.1 translation initiation factor IF-5A [Nitrososphaerota archaeon]